MHNNSDGAWIYKHIVMGGENDGGEMLGCNKAQWIGLLAEDVEQLVHEYPSQLRSVEQVDATVLAQRTKSLETQVDAKHHPVIQAQCQAMRRLSLKAEIECLTGIGPKYLLNVYLAQKLQHLGALPFDMDYSDWDRNLHTESQAATDARVEQPAAPVPLMQYSFEDIPALEYATQVPLADLGLANHAIDGGMADALQSCKAEPVQQIGKTAAQRWWWESSEDDCSDA